MALAADAGFRTLYLYQVSNSYAFPFGSYVTLPVSALVDHGDLDLETGVLYCTWGGKPSTFGVSVPFLSWELGLQTGPTTYGPRCRAQTHSSIILPRY